MTRYTTSIVAEIINGTLIQLAKDEIIRTLLIDSRKIAFPENALFFAIKGDRHNGHTYIPELYEKGIRNFITEDIPQDLSLFENANFIQVNNVILAIQKLAAFHREKHNLNVIAITGSNGKTIIKEWLYQLLNEDFNIVRSPKSYNSQVGVPLSIWQINKEHDLGIFEAGISKPGEMLTLEKIIKPQMGIFTNIGEAHAENFKNQAEKIKEKLDLFNHSETLIYCRDYILLGQEILLHPGLKNIKLFTWSKKAKADLQIAKINKMQQQTEIQAIYNMNFLRIKIPFTDEASIENAIHCWSYMLFKGYDNEFIAKRMLSLNPVAMRLELKEGINNCSVINDSYNSDLGSLSIALDFLNQQQQHEKKTLVLSDILQTGKNEEQLYSEVAQMISNQGISRIVGIGEAISRQAGKFNVHKLFFNDTADFLKNFSSDFFSNETILLKGARVFGFEKISKLLQQKAHETVLEINLDAVIDNLNYFRSKLNPSTKIVAMVKAFSYGSGSFEIANLLQFHRIDYLAVAYADEAIELRKAGIKTPIMVMNPLEQSYDAMIHYKLEPEIYSFKILDLFSDAVKRNLSLLQEPFPVHLKLDTGMRRLGFDKHEINELVVRIKNNKNLVVKSVFSHLSASDEEIHDAFTREQISSFKEMSQRIIQYLDYPILRHILNSAGIVRFPESQFEMVRLGVGLYGIGANKYEQSRLKNVSTLKTSISQIRNVKQGESIGYSRKAIAASEMKIAIVPIGYADGYNRGLSNGKGKMFVNGKEAKVVGNVCMDMCMIDITGVNAKEGDEVIVFGAEYPITDIALELNTIPYEILTNVSRRVKRIYFHE
ncbi:MAG: bifunctional UDP-N-acetylmuramoyl-tripeptide:D-alanyl-D-alanine ligase/alanine racemase [Bacteroidetes bacterium]|nr:bifunctional UDP-N-acetylmuramoyl-tripeptide:D-alanyl-D-alanine ligase/alanine racemase [Bacteroidota bacterium]HET6244718.1 bifunctional UDP-N-acetylmuramoyl-tripeptide:D-alanyl-D-alanine ligase/alanine racemase [Bacteroidia bacterium]